MGTRIFNIISWVGVALVVAAVGIRAVAATGIPIGLVGQEKYGVYLAWTGLACIVVYVASQWRDIGRFLGSRSGRHGSVATIGIVVLLAILVAVNYIGKRQNKRWDLTQNSQFSLADQSRGIVAKLDEPLQVQVFDQEARFQQHRDRLKEYEYASPQVKAEYIDPDKKPAVAQQAQVKQYGTLVFTYKGRTERITQSGEQDITNAIIKVVSGRQPKAYFVKGHGERDVELAERDGYQGIAQALKAENYTVATLVLAQAATVPADADVVVVAGPRTDYFGPEVDALKQYLARNGKLLLMFDAPTSADGSPMPNLASLARDWGVEVTNSIVVDASGMGRLIGAGPEVPIAANYPPHPITQRFTVLTAFPMTRGLALVTGGSNGHIASEVVKSSDQSWAEADLKGLLGGGEVSLDPTKGDRTGPVVIAAAANAAGAPEPGAAPDAPKPEARVVVFGDADFASNAALGIQGNRDLFLNTLGWLTQQENLIAIRPKDASDRRLTMTAVQQQLVMVLALAGVPALVLAAGIFVWSRRR